MALAIAAWTWTPLGELVDLERVSGWFDPYRHTWYALPLVAAIYVVLGLALFPVLVLIAATGVAFGPWLGPVYALVGSLTSATAGFFIGRSMGLRRIQKIGGRRVSQITNALRRNGTLAVFVMRKVPAPFTLSNVVAGASGVRYRDFMTGTVLGMGVFVVALAGFGYQLSRVLTQPTPARVGAAVAMLSLPLLLAWFINRRLRETRGRREVQHAR
jgi:uncharacterized membrane protein YdjX (TVP38/TMEM64 family)